ncbi:hypothetical protein Daura_23520 [Dactylosporangium aurantiacum]|uniref:Uncharacterized protein n=1 Tax=Dactylosporangium aurantiacum TaxID=35754 RepID=A0A9Q9ITV4_9ACTN|nr:hypothetical protein [Dactylosporangium aurantiacum]MDG6103941.1 hypothetical protein [Dactylosporangium aurantiacum]UWZ58873.1 hypothetical protein Daura_23520 [Dactylosporangium aurantiacum]
MNSSRSIHVPVGGRTALGAVGELGLPTILGSCASCRSARLDTATAFRRRGADATAPLEVIVRSEKLLVSRPTLRGMADAGRVRLPCARRRLHVPRPVRRVERPWRTVRRLYGMRRR